MQQYQGDIMSQTLIKVDYKGLNCKGIYYVTAAKIPTITKENLPKQHTHKFVIRQTVTIEGIGKKTAKETSIIEGITFYKALQQTIDSRNEMRQRTRNKLLGRTTDHAEDNKLKTITVNQLWDEYSLYKTNSATAPWSTAYAYTMQSDYKRLVKPYIGKMRAIQVKREHIELCLDKARHRGLKPRSDYAVVTVVKPLYDWWLTRKELSKPNPAQRLELRPLNNAVSVNLSWEQIERLYTILYTYPDERYRQLFIWLSTGRRNGEALSLETRHTTIDGYYTITAENNKARTDMIYRLPMGITLPLLKGWVHTAPRNRHNPLQAVTVNQIWQNIRRRSNLPLIRRHDLRHILTTVLANSAVPLEIRSMVLGHTLNGVTNRYRTDTREGADLKHRAVTFFLDKVFNRINREMLWNEYITKE